MKKYLGLVALILALVLSVGVVGAQGKVLVTGLGMVGGDLETIDPGLAETSASIQVINQIFLGLTWQDVTNGSRGMGLATDMKVSDDGTVYTFTLMADVPWVHYNAETGAVEEAKDADGNTRYVTAQDVVDGMVRALAPETASPYSYVLIPYVVGAAEFNGGTGSADAVGVKAIDATTVEITAPEAVAFTPSIYGLWMARPIPAWAVEEGGDTWTEPEFIYTNGPFALKEWAHEQSLTLIKNPFWPGNATVPQAKLDEVTLKFLDPAAQFDEYQAGSLDAISVPLEQLDFVKSDATLSAEYQTGTNPCTYYIGFDNTTAPSDNVHLRRALSFAIDRQSIVDNVTKGGQIPAQWFSRPGLAAAPTLETNPDLGVKFDPAFAKSEFDLALADLGMTAADLGGILTLTYNGSAGHGAIMTAIQQMWKDNLGLEIQLATLDPTTYFSAISEDAPTAYRAGWCQDYPDANNFLFDVFYSKSSQNDPGFSSPEYDALVEQARVETDEAVRRDLYAQAEQILVVDQAGIAPIYWYTTNQLIKPYVENVPSVTGNEAYYLWDINK